MIIVKNEFKEIGDLKKIAEEELREDSQLIVITHQKRTMEIADALYGVSMRGDGVTTVIGQRLRGSKEPGDIDVSEIPVEAQPA